MITSLMPHATIVAALSAVDHPIWLVVAGFAAGLLGGMVGIGGGVLVVPALMFAAGIGERAAIATSLAAMVPMSMAATYRQHRYGNVRLADGLWLGVMGIVGAAVGATLADVLPEHALRIGFAVIMLLLAAHMVRSTRRAARLSERPTPGDVSGGSAGR
jgi:uncharacterized membrane protein YfcA